MTERDSFNPESTNNCITCEGGCVSKHAKPGKDDPELREHLRVAMQSCGNKGRRIVLEIGRCYISAMVLNENKKYVSRVHGHGGTCPPWLPATRSPRGCDRALLLPGAEWCLPAYASWHGCTLVKQTSLDPELTVFALLTSMPCCRNNHAHMSECPAEAALRSTVHPP